MTCGAITNRRLYKYGTGAGGKYEGNEGATQEPEKTRKDERKGYAPKNEKGTGSGPESKCDKNMQKPKNHAHATPNAAISRKQESAPLTAISKKYQRRLQ